MSNNQSSEKFPELEKALADSTAKLKQRDEELAVINSVQEGLAAQMDNRIGFIIEL